MEAAFAEAELVTWTEANRALATGNYRPDVGTVPSGYAKKTRTAWKLHMNLAFDVNIRGGTEHPVCIVLPKSCAIGAEPGTSQTLDNVRCETTRAELRTQ